MKAVIVRVLSLRRVVLALLLLAGTGVQAREVEVEGVAMVVDGAVAEARQQAMEDGMRQAAWLGGATVHSSSLTVDHALVQDTTRVSGETRVQLLAVIKEWQSEDGFHVLLKVQIEDAPPPVETVDPYLKKVAFSQFEVINRGDIQDLPEIERLLPQHLMARLAAGDKLVTVDATRYLLSALAGQRAAVGEAPPRDTVTSVAAELGAQVIVQGVIRTMATVVEGFGYRRMVALDIRVIDGISGVVIGTRPYRASVAGGADLMAAGGFADPQFVHHPVGELLRRMVEQEVSKLATDLESLPFSARVLRSEGDRIYFDAGAVNRVRVGDHFTAYHLDRQALSAAGPFLGYVENPVTTLVVKRVQPLFAQGVLADPSRRLLPGDIVRISARTRSD